MGDIAPHIDRQIEMVTFKNENAVEVGGVRIDGTYHQFEDHSLPQPPVRLDRAAPSGPESRRISSRLMSARFVAFFTNGTSGAEETAIREIADLLTKNHRDGSVRFSDEELPVESETFRERLTRLAKEKYKFSSGFGKSGI